MESNLNSEAEVQEQQQAPSEAKSRNTSGRSAKPVTREKRSRHGLRRVMAAVKLRGLDAIDRRTASAQALIAWKAELLRDLGGDISSQRKALVDVAVRNMFYISHVDAWLMQQPTLVRKRSKSVLPALKERQALCDGLLRTLSALGLDRTPVPIVPLHRYILDAEKTADVEPSPESADPCSAARPEPCSE